MSCWHDDHAKLIGHLRARRIKRAVEVMRRHLDALEESLDLGRTSTSRTDLRTILGGHRA
jgi:DNA-binding GntR family transcriptional regulator